MHRRLLLLLLAFLLAFLAAPLAAQVDPELLSGMKARSIGPAGMSGRIAAIEAVESNPNVIYVGASTGGVWKSENAGLTWKPIFDDQPVHSIGAVAVFQPNPDIVWVGTGEGNTRNSVSIGDGLYNSLDAGRTWTHKGLTETERIHRILTHPTYSSTVYVCALGRLWGENAERGVFKTTDGGKTWKKILYVDERSGCADLAMDPANPNKLIAALWEFRRWPWFFRSGGPGSGLYVTVDGGETWEKRTVEDGLPEGDLGRMGVAFSRAYPNIVYALAEAEKSALLRSDDGGRSWKKVNEETNIVPRPFYYADLRVDPEFPNRVYSLHSRVTVSNDSGKSFETLVPFRNIHPDHH
ncbi:MAG: WD40/YVTN/BNR-like repeat-containing protein, partial [Candidatus Acidiferrales bacterium]